MPAFDNRTVMCIEFHKNISISLPWIRLHFSFLYDILNALHMAQRCILGSIFFLHFFSPAPLITHERFYFAHDKTKMSTYSVCRGSIFRAYRYATNAYLWR